MNDNIFRLFLVVAYIITKLFTFQVLFAQFYIFLPVHDAHFLLLFSSPFVLGCIHKKPQQISLLRFLLQVNPCFAGLQGFEP